MDADAKKTTLRMIPYGIYVLTADDGKGLSGAARVNWVAQASVNTPLVAEGVKADSGSYAALKSAQGFVLNMPAKEHKGLAFAFFKPAKIEDGEISGQSFTRGSTGAPTLDAAMGAVECRVRTIVEEGDHHIVVGEVIAAHLHRPPAGRPDAAILEMKDLGDTVFYGG